MQTGKAAIRLGPMTPEKFAGLLNSGYDKFCFRHLRNESSMLKYSVAVFILAFGFCGARHPAPQPPAARTVDVEAERYAVYSVLLNRTFEKPGKVLVIQSETNKDSTFDDEWQRIEPEPAWKTAVDDYKVKNLRPAIVEAKFSLPTKVTLISKDEVEKFFCEGCGWWAAFYKKYPDAPGLITFSNVGFNEEMNYALVDFSYMYNGLGGGGGLLLLIKKDGKWVKERQLTAWVA
jgi:hypothetical protein